MSWFSLGADSDDERRRRDGIIWSTLGRLFGRGRRHPDEEDDRPVNDSDRGYPETCLSRPGVRNEDPPRPK